VQRLLRLTGVEVLKFRGKSVTWMTWILLFIFPIGIEVCLLAWVSQEAAVFPGVARLLFAGTVLLLVALTTTVVSVMALGDDYDLGTVRVFLSQGVERYQFVLSKVLATVVIAFANGVAYISGALLAAIVAHVAVTDVPLTEAAGAHLAWRALGAVGVIALVGFVSIGVVMLALVVGRNAWVGMLVGLGAFLGDFALGGFNIVRADVYRYTVTYHVLSLAERLFEAHTGLDMSDAAAAHSLVEPGKALAVLLFYGCAFTLAAILIFRRQDLMVKS
jgi:ABC-type transport system involved in multi-copper enzyme maturation permease subunit